MPKVFPLIVTGVPAMPEFGERPVMLGGTVKLMPLLPTPPSAITTTFPVVADGGTTTEILEALQLVGAAAPPLNVTLPALDPKLAPEIVIGVPTTPLATERLVMFGAGVTVNGTPGLATPPAAVTTTFPVVVPVRTDTPMLVELQLVMVSVFPLNFTEPLPCDGPKLLPAIVTLEPIAPEFGLRLLIAGAGVTVNVTPPDDTPPAAVTTTFPVVAPAGTTATMLLALQLVIVAVVPLNFTLPLPCVAPKLLPATVIDDPTAPVFGLRLVMLGAEVMVKDLPALAIPPAAVTTTLPVVAPVGTVATMLLALQLVTVAAVPLNFTEPLPCDGPKLLPAIVMEEPTAPVPGVSVLMLGADVTVNTTPVLA